MAQGDTPITIVGNLVADPELRFTPSGAAVATFRVASTPRVFNSQAQQWEDGEALFLSCNVWRQAAENVAESLTKGSRVIVNGRLRQRSYQTREGENRTVFEVEVDEVGPSLRYATAQVTRTPREGGQGSSQGSSQGGGFRQGGRGQSQGSSQGGGFRQGGQGQSGPGPSQGGSRGGFGSQSPAEDPWNSAPQSGGGFDDGDDEPPF